MYLDLFDIYHSKQLDPDEGPRQLQNKVQWDIRFYFARRGAENMYNMKKTTFAVKNDDKTGVQYVVKCEDEATKNHKKNEHDIVSGYMPSIDNKYCPVKSFIKYTQSLHPESDKLWQTPKYNRFPTNNKDIWYGPGNVGHNKLDSFTTNIAKKCGLHDKGYTNHSLRASGITTLKRNDFNDKQVMSVTGHRSRASLDIYQKVAADEKLRMGLTLGYALTGDSGCLTKENEVTNIYQQHPQVNRLPKQSSSHITHPSFRTIDNQPEPLTKRRALLVSRETSTSMPIKRPCVNYPLHRESCLNPTITGHSSTWNESIFDDDSVSDTEIMNAVSEYEDGTAPESLHVMQHSEANVTNIQCMSRQILTMSQQPTFSNCKIDGGIVINIHKN